MHRATLHEVYGKCNNAVSRPCCVQRLLWTKLQVGCRIAGGPASDEAGANAAGSIGLPFWDRVVAGEDAGVHRLVGACRHIFGRLELLALPSATGPGGLQRTKLDTFVELKPTSSQVTLHACQLTFTT